MSVGTPENHVSPFKDGLIVIVKIKATHIKTEPKNCLTVSLKSVKTELFQRKTFIKKIINFNS